MGIDRDDSDERQARLDWMIDEFRQAQSRRLVKVPDHVLEPPPEADPKAAVDGPACPPTPAIPLTGK